jgi:hypothetical protein
MNANSLIDWLLEARTPSIRYFTLRNLLDRPEADSDVRAARKAIATTGPVPAVLAQQTAKGHWEGEHGYYTPKYVSTHWSMALMVELAADPGDPHLQRGADFMLAATATEAVTSHAAHRQDLACFWGNVLRYMVYCGRAEDPRVAAIVETLVLASQSRGWGCHHNGELACAWGAARALWGLAALPAPLRTSKVEAAMQSGLAFVLDGAALIKGDYPTDGQIHKHWSRMNFPLFYQADILFTLRVVADLGLLDHLGVQPALSWLADRRQSNGRWRGASPYRSRTWAALGDSTETNRWVSLQAATVLKQAGYVL